MSFKEFYIKENESEFDFEYFKSLSHFSKQLLYAKGKLKRLGAGSSRIVFEYEDRALKIAKNNKGVDQNEVEGDPGIHNMYKEILPNLFRNDKDYKWILIEKAEKINKKEFEKLADINYDVYCGLLTKYELKTRYHKHIELTDEEEDLLYEKDGFLKTLIDMSANFDFITNDFKKLTSLGRINNRIVVIDFGFTDSVYNKHYSRK